MKLEFFIAVIMALMGVIILLKTFVIEPILSWFAVRRLRRELSKWTITDEDIERWDAEHRERRKSSAWAKGA